MRYLLPVLVLALAACSSGTSEKTPATIATARPSATQQAQPAERPSAAPTPASVATAPPAAPSEAPPTDVPVIPTEPPAPTPGQPIVSVPTTAPPAPTMTPPPPATVQPPPPAGDRLYPCEAGDCNCSDFPSHAEAQRVFLKHGGTASNNWSRLDGNDHDGIVCESLP